MNVGVPDARKLSADALEDLRRRAVAAVESGVPQVQVARLFGVSRQTVNEWVQAYRANGDQAFRPRRRGRRPGEQRALEPWQQSQIIETVTSGYPDQAELPYFLWTRQAVADLISHRFRIALSLVAVGKYLQRWGFTLPKPPSQAIEQSPVAVAHWLKTEYLAVAKAAKTEGAEILWVQQTSLHVNYSAESDRTTALEEIYGAEEHNEVKILAAVSNRGHMLFVVHADPLDTTLFSDFLNRVWCQAQRNVCVIVGQHLVHNSWSWRTWLEANREHVAVHTLPD